MVSYIVFALTITNIDSFYTSKKRDQMSRNNQCLFYQYFERKPFEKKQRHNLV